MRLLLAHIPVFLVFTGFAICIKGLFGNSDLLLIGLVVWTLGYLVCGYLNSESNKVGEDK